MMNFFARPIVVPFEFNGRRFEVSVIRDRGMWEVIVFVANSNKSVFEDHFFGDPDRRIREIIDSAADFIR